MNEGDAMGTALMTLGRGELVVSRAKITTEALAEAAEQRKLLGQYVANHMIEGQDYGIIPGTERKDRNGDPAPTPKTLLKPGAEKLTELFCTTPKFTQTNKVEDWDKGFFHYEFKCTIVLRDTDVALAEGVGSCNSRESRYRWRNSKRVCPQCQKDTINRSKFPPRDRPEAAPGWYCYAAKGGCGANFDATDPVIMDQVAGRTENPDIADTVNTVLKMAKKRALVDAAIALARCSDIFTQDMEDFHDGGDQEPPKQAPRQAKPTENNSAWKDAAYGDDKPAAPAQAMRDASPGDREAIEQQVFDCLTEMATIRGKKFDDAYWATCRALKFDYASLADFPYGQLGYLRDVVVDKLEKMLKEAGAAVA